MKKLLWLLLLASTAFSQTHTFPATDTNNTFTGTNALNGGGALRGTWTGGPPYTISSCSESGNVATCTTTTPCSAITATYFSIVISGTSVAGYSTGPSGLIGFVTTGACSGSTFSYFNPTSGLGASTGGTVTLAPIFSQGLTHTGPETVSGQLTMTNHNQIFWAGPGTTPTIDQAISACGTNPCVVEVSPQYTGAESTLLIDPNNSGNPFFSGANNVTVIDRRAITSGGGKNYSLMFGGRTAGELTRMGIVNYCNSPTDSCSSGFNLTFLNGTMPSNNGEQMGNTAVLVPLGTLTFGASASILAGQDTEVELRSVGQDMARIPLIAAHTATVNSDRSYSNTAVSSVAGFYAGNHSKAGGTGALWTNAYGFMAANQGNGSVQNYGFYNQGNWLTDNETQFHALDVGTAYTITAASESGSTATFTTSIVCTLTTGQYVTVAGVTNASYNGRFSVLSPGCNAGNTFTVSIAGTFGLTASSGGTATGNTPRSTVYYRSTNGILYQPLSDTVGWDWQQQGGTQLFSINSSRIQISKPTKFGGDATPAAAAGAFLGSAALPWAGLTLGTAATNNFTFNPAATAQATTINVPDPVAASVTLAYRDIAQTFTGVQTFTNNVQLTALISKYNNITTAGNGVASILASVNTTGLTANVGSTNALTAPATGTYRMSCYLVLTTAGTTSTLPACQGQWTDPDTNALVPTPANITTSSTTNTVGTNSTASSGLSQGQITFQAKTGTSIFYDTTGYASTGTAMQYALHVKLEFLGN